MNQQFVYAIARSEGQALQIENHLTQSGFSNDEISALIPDKDSPPEFAHMVHTHAQDGTMTGDPVGGVLGGAMGLLASVSALLIPGVGRLIAVGPMLAALSGVANGAAAVGIFGALVGMGVPERDARLYENHIVDGHILIAVHAETADEVQRAREVMEHAMAEDIAVLTSSDTPPE